VNLTPYSLDPTPGEAGDNMTYRPSNSDDIIYNFLHGGAGDDLVSRAVSRYLAPGIMEYLFKLSRADGADGMRAADAGTDPLRNGEPNRELGVVIQSGFAWGEQTSVPADPQPGNANGTARDVLRAARLQRRHGPGLRHRQRPVYGVRWGLPGVADQVRRRCGGYVRRRRMATHLFRAEGERRRRQADGRLQVQRRPGLRLPIADRLQVRRRWRVA